MTKLPIAGFFLLASGLSAVAQQPTGTSRTVPDSGAVTLKVQTRLTVEDVTVTDSKGNPVHGLTQADFTVKEDGNAQTIKNFQESGPEQPQAPPLQLPPGTYTNRQAIASSAVSLLLFDDLTAGGGVDPRAASAEAVMWERLQALKYLDTIPPGSAGCHS